MAKVDYFDEPEFSVFVDAWDQLDLGCLEIPAKARHGCPSGRFLGGVFCPHNSNNFALYW